MSSNAKAPLRVGYVPEHFSTPLHFAQKHHGANATLVPFPSGTGHMITSLRAGEIDVGVGLTEGWIAGLGSKPGTGLVDRGYMVVGTYVESPLCWAISTGARRSDVAGVDALRGRRCGVSRVGSGSYVMAHVLADQQGWLDGGDRKSGPFSFVPLQTFAQLRAGVNEQPATADFFMWEHFTSKRYHDSGEEIRRVGEIYTPWPSWTIVATEDVAASFALEDYLTAVNRGIRHLQENPDEAVEYISTELDYTADDARQWLKTVRFSPDVERVEPEVIRQTIRTLRKAGVMHGDPAAEARIEAQMMCGSMKRYYRTEEDRIRFS